MQLCVEATQWHIDKIHYPSNYCYEVVILLIVLFIKSLKCDQILGKQSKSHISQNQTYTTNG